MKSRCWLTSMMSIGLCFCCFTPGCSKGNTKAQVQSDLQKLYDEQAIALDRKDMTGAYAHFAPDCVFIGEQNHAYNLAQDRMEMTRTFGGMDKDLKFSSSIHQFSPNNPNLTQVTTAVTRTLRGTLFIQQLQRKAPVTLSAEIHDFWVKGANGWQIKREKIETPQAIIDGKRFIPPSPGR